MESKGLRKQSKGWIEHYNKEPLTEEMIKGYLSDIFKSKESTLKYKEWVHHQWEEAGQYFSMWCNGGLCTGDAGYKTIMDSSYETAVNHTGMKELLKDPEVQALSQPLHISLKEAINK